MSSASIRCSDVTEKHRTTSRSCGFPLVDLQANQKSPATENSDEIYPRRLTRPPSSSSSSSSSDEYNNAAATFDPIQIFPSSGRPLPVEVLQALLLWLRASDITALSVISKAATSPGATAIFSTAVASFVKNRYGRANPGLREDDDAWKRDLETLRHAELTHLSALVMGSKPRPGKGYYLSKAWAGNLRRYVEAQARRRRSPLSSSPNSAGKEKRRRGRIRAESNLMPPWSEVNADITCPHGGLAHSSQGTRCKRQAVDKRVWKELVAFFPRATAFRVESPECLECLGKSTSEREAEEAVRKEREQEISLPVLKALFGRKTGVPPASLATASPSSGAGIVVGAEAEGNSPPKCPLLPGIYHLVPRYWLNAWRAYVRNPRAPRLRTLDTALLLCEGHGLLVTPPHVEDFLAGNNRYLLGGLDPDRSGCVCEVLTPEEWDALTLLHPCDLGVRFCIDPDNGTVQFNTKRCRSCDPCYIGVFYRHSSTRKISF